MSRPQLMAGAERPKVVPKVVHWLGDRSSAESTHHAEDRRGCVLYFETEQQCINFVDGLTAEVVGSPHV